MKCTNCGCENPVYAVVCEQCGSFLPKEDIFVPKKDETILEASEPNDLEPMESEQAGTEQTESEQIVLESNGAEQDDAEPLEPKPTFVEPTVPKPAPVPEGMIRCRSCWEYNPKTAAVCEHCGKSLHPMGARAIEDSAFETLLKKKSETITCVNCGNVVPWNTMTCSNCGKQPRLEQYEEDDFDDEGAVVRAAIGLVWDIVKPQKSSRDQAPDFSQSGAAQIRCRKCWETSPPGSVTCQHCGARLPSEMKVRPISRPLCTCGYKNLPGVTVCLKCKGVVM
ncbi:MAG: zinc ribbon domain-containing protein [Lachnospiraceae bacterium]|nr:zinc ribbon domain-containing protein [Lachnospiraceae bacterium]